MTIDLLLAGDLLKLVLANLGNHMSTRCSIAYPLSQNNLLVSDYYYFITRFKQDPAAVSVLLDILIVLPEEVSSHIFFLVPITFHLVLSDKQPFLALGA